MVRVNGVESAAVFMNMYPDPSVGKNVIHLHISAPNSETALWGADDALTIEADWRQELGGVRYAAKEGLASVLSCCSVQGKFNSHVDDLLGGGQIFVTLNSIGFLRPLDHPTSPQISHSLPRGGK